MRCVIFFACLNLLLTFQILPAQAPDTLWTRTYGSGEGYCVIETSDHGYLIVGKTLKYFPDSDILFLKTDSIGDTLWTKTFRYPNGDVGYSVRQTPDSGFIIVGVSSSNGAGWGDVWLIKTNANGDTLWTKTFGGNSPDIGKCVQITSDRGFIIVGSTSSYGAGGIDVLLIKTDSNGDTLWTKTYGGVDDDWGDYVQQTSDSGYIIVGGSVSFNTARRGELWLIKIDSNSDTLWTKTYPGYIYGNCVLETSDGYIISATRTYYPVLEKYSGCLIKTNFSGDTLWTKIVLQIGEKSVNRCPSVTMTYNDCYLISGSVWILGRSIYPSNSGYILMADVNGNVVWTKELCQSMWYRSSINSAVQTSDGGYVATGSYRDSLFLAKVAPSITGLKKSEDVIAKDYSLFQNYPNPFNPSTTIEFDLPKTSEVTLKVFNILGEEVASLVSDRLSAGSYSYEWDASKLASGVYLYRLQAGDYVETRKMVLMR